MTERPSFCGSCHYSSIPVDAEPGGGSYDENEFACGLLGPEESKRRCTDTDVWRDPELVWGESPICTDADWAVQRYKDGIVLAMSELGR